MEENKYFNWDLIWSHLSEYCVFYDKYRTKVKYATIDKDGSVNLWSRYPSVKNSLFSSDDHWSEPNDDYKISVPHLRISTLLVNWKKSLLVRQIDSRYNNCTLTHIIFDTSNFYDFSVSMVKKCIDIHGKISQDNNWFQYIDYEGNFCELYLSKVLNCVNTIGYKQFELYFISNSDRKINEALILFGKYLINIQNKTLKESIDQLEIYQHKIEQVKNEIEKIKEFLNLNLK